MADRVVRLWLGPEREVGLPLAVFFGLGIKTVDRAYRCKKRGSLQVSLDNVAALNKYQ